MINTDNLPAVLKTLGFQVSGKRQVWSNGSTTVSVDLAAGLINYPTDDGLVVNDATTCNFSANENFVVLECVVRLLAKGYRLQHIELEPRWQLGRGASGGKADVLVRDQQRRPLLIIECKTLKETLFSDPRPRLPPGKRPPK